MTENNNETIQGTTLSKGQKRGLAVAGFAAAALLASTGIILAGDEEKPVTEIETVTPEPKLEPVAVVMPAADELPNDYKELPQMSIKPEPIEIVAYAKPYIPEIKTLNLDIALVRIESDDLNVSAQATKDMGYFFANGKEGLPESDAMANAFYEAALQNSDGKNIQAAHDLGYHLLHGKGAKADYNRAYELLTYADEHGHPLSKPMIKYMDNLGLSPK